MEYLIKNTILNKDLSKIVYSYVDYSVNNLVKNLSKERINFVVYMDGDIMDNLLMAIRFGHKGFFIPSSYPEIYESIKELVKFDDRIEFSNSSDKFFIGLKILDNKIYKYCDITLLGSLKIRIKN
jgi:deoxyribodipyrimidine photolyase